MNSLFPDFPANDTKNPSKKYTEDILLQALACICSPFSKSTILSLSAHVGEKMKGSKKFLDTYLSKGIICEKPVNTTTQEYIVSVEAWESLIRAIQPEHIQRMIALAKRVNIQNDANFALAAYQFYHGQDYTSAVGQINPHRYYTQEVSYTGQLVKQMGESEQMLPFLKSLNNGLIDILAKEYLERLYNLDYSNTDLYMMKHLILDHPTYPKTQRDELRFEIGLYTDFVRHLQLDKAVENCTGCISYTACLKAFERMQHADYDAAFKLFVAALKGSGLKHFMDPVVNFYYAIALANTSLAAAQIKIGALFKDENFGRQTTMVMRILLLIMKGQKKQITLPLYFQQCTNLINKALLLLVAKHYRLPGLPDTDDLLDEIDQRPVRLLQMEMSADFPRYSQLKLTETDGLHPTLPPYAEREEWDLKLEELMKLHGGKGKDGKKTALPGSTARIVYEVNRRDLSVQPKLQKSKDGINWSGGRNISLEKFAKGLAEAMTDEDRKVAACVKSYSHGWYNNIGYTLGGGKTIATLIGHPYVFDAANGNPLDIVSDKPQLSVKLKDGRFVFTSDIEWGQTSDGYFTTSEGNCIKVVKITTNLSKTLFTLGGMSFPEQAKDRLTQLLELLSSEIVVMGDLLKNSDNVTTRQAHAETIVRLQPSGESLRCQLLVRPFGKVPPVCTPGKGMQTITTTIDGKQVQTKRNLKKEKENLTQVQQLMVDFEEDPYSENVWNLSPDECLTLLEQLQEMKGCAKVEWPEGEKMRVARAQLTPQDFNVRISSIANWFELSGDILISADKKMKIADLMEKIAQSKGNFIQLSDNEFVRLADELRRHIDLLERVASVHQDKIRLSQFNAPLLDSLAQDGVTIDADKTYTQLVERISRSNDAEIKIPKTVNADLRSYQKEGYLWMSRLALWGAGALLADDMGLGKTLQAITLLLSRAAKGPQLVVVPTSVSLNWYNEIDRFAPSLRVRQLNAPSEDRKEIIGKAKEFDIVITTYGLLSNEEELLVSRTWVTIVLDEAHTIKNRETKMSQSAMKLKADFRLLLTGTPLQNHVSELWNLMQFANPGLLGSYQDFTARFLLPIERDHNKERQRLLKRIITPFLLRRTKSEVLSELPEKTEITLKVDLSPDEWAFYDNIRQKALAEMENSTTTAVQALAEITRLRQAACNVRLVEDGLDIPSSKMDSFLELVGELHANHHRALVFSQFTSHLALVRERLDREGIHYLYLDGSTPAKERIRLVEEFQQGDMPLFLISLKAGGLGLNLTAADYVVHLDPWWNPAIEEQASDRAYRIGQHKPVTVYRLISTGTIEEKIIDLHATKRNMADALLEGGDISASLSREEMLQLLGSL